MKLVWWKIGFAAMFLINLILAFELYQTKLAVSHPLADISLYIDNPVLPNVTLSNREGGEFDFTELAGEYSPTVLVFFSPSDCPNCFAEKVIWAELVQRGKARVYGIAVSADSREFWLWASRSRIPVDVYLDTTFAIFDSMQFKVTPLKVLLDDEGRPVWADPPRLSVQEQEQFWEDFDNAIARFL
jgi:peroxiredoxin